MHSLPTFDWTHGDLAEGLRLYNAGEYFTAHESWETVWLATPEPGKTFLQGVIQVTAAMEHRKRNNPLGTTRLLQNALRRLEPCLAAPYPPNFGGLALPLLCGDIHQHLHALESNQPTARLAPPRIHPLLQS